MSNNILCPKCKGERYIFNPGCFFLTLGLPFVLICESMEDDYKDRTFTKRRCPTCLGKGKINLDE